jgi:hypothetical protein
MKIIPLAIGMAGAFYAAGNPAPRRATITRIWSETCVNLQVEAVEGGEAFAPTSVFVPPLGTRPEESPASGWYFLPDDFVALASAKDPIGRALLFAGTEKQKTQTFGQKAVGLQFNPSNQDDVAMAKAEAAALIDRAHDLRQASASPEVKRMASLAITHAQEAQMWLVKAQTWKD